jgi:HK97 family phage portal protein
VVLNNGLDFQEASNTSVEMQLNENKKTNSTEICRMFITPPSILDGTASVEVYNNWIKVCILPILIAIQTALNKDLLLQSEKGSFYFAFDTKELLKGDIEKRFKAYEIASKNGIMQIDEIRYREDLEPLGLDFIKLGLQDVLYNPKTKEIYTPNTNKTTDMTNPDKQLGGGE